MRKMILGSIIGIVAFAISNVSFSAEIAIKPKKITASSELTFYPGHTAKFAGDGKISLLQYWCSDFKNKKKPPHWLEFDFGSPKKFNQIQLYMHSKYNRTLLLDDFALKYWDGNAWKPIFEKHGYVKSYTASLRKKNPPDKYFLSVPNDAPVFWFNPVTSSKVRLYVFKTGDGNARVHEMVFSFTEKTQSSTKTNTKPNPLETKTIQNGLKCFDFGSSTSAKKTEFLKVAKQTKFEGTNAYGWLSAPSLTECDRSFPNDLKRDFIFSAEPAEFKIKLPNGEYYVYFLSGDALFSSPGMNYPAPEGRGIRKSQLYLQHKD